MNQDIYFDYAASAPLNQEVMLEVLQHIPTGNPSSIHEYGQFAKTIEDKCTNDIRLALNLTNDYEVIYTSGATEANNMVVNSFEDHKIFTTSAEHMSMLFNADVRELSILDETLEDFISLLELQIEKSKEDIILVSVMSKSNITGTIFLTQEMTFELKQLKNYFLTQGKNVYLHTDATQIFTKMESLTVDFSVFDFITISGHKIGATKGIGALIVNKSCTCMLKNVLRGGNEQDNHRAGTVPTDLILIFSECILYNLNKLKHYDSYSTEAYVYFTKTMFDKFGMRFAIYIDKNYPQAYDIFSFAIRGINGESLVVRLSDKGIMLSTGAACSRDMGNYVMADVVDNHYEYVRCSWDALSITEDYKELIDKFVSMIVETVEELDVVNSALFLNERGIF